MKNYTIKKQALFELIDSLINTTEVVAPVKQENSANFKKIKSHKEIVWQGPQTIIPPKKYLTPTSEELFSYDKSSKDMQIKTFNEPKKRVIFGIHPCDLNAIYLMNQVFAEKNMDEFYFAKRKSAIIIGVDCLELCSPEAICYRMDGLNPRDRFDAFLTDMGDKFFVRAQSDQSGNVFKHMLMPASKSDIEKLSQIESRRNKLFDKNEKKLLPDYNSLPDLLEKNYNSPEWEARGKKDYACGSCNMVCPTCYCFDVQDYMKVNLKDGKRERVWDGCMLLDFAKIASGENFREKREERLRHRTNRKLNYLFKKWGQSFCTGCGRCIKSCLTKIVSPLEIANALYGEGGK